MGQVPLYTERREGTRPNTPDEWVDGVTPTVSPQMFLQEDWSV